MGLSTSVSDGPVSKGDAGCSVGGATIVEVLGVVTGDANLAMTDCSDEERW